MAENSKNYLDLFNNFPDHESLDNVIKNINKLKNDNKKIIGIGETGLDFYYNYSDKKIQKKKVLYIYQHKRETAYWG